jgi:hypothetical protein
MAVTSAASRTIQAAKSNTRKPSRQRTGYQWVHISLLLVSLETRYFNGLAVEVPDTVLPLKDTVIKFSSSDLLTWPSFTAILFDHLRPLPPTIDLTNRDLWGLSYASSFSGKKIVTVPNTDKYRTPSSMLASGHFGNNQAGQLKVLVVLTSTDVVDKQEPVTPLRPDEYATPVKEEKKRKVKQEDTGPASNHRKRIKREDHANQDDDTESKSRVKPETNIKTKPEESIQPALMASCWSPTDDELESIADEIVVREDGADLFEVEDCLDDTVFSSLADPARSGDVVHGGDKTDETDIEQAVIPEFVRGQLVPSSQSQALIQAGGPEPIASPSARRGCCRGASTGTLYTL